MESSKIILKAIRLFFAIIFLMMTITTLLLKDRWTSIIFLVITILLFIPEIRSLKSLRNKKYYCKKCNRQISFFKFLLVRLCDSCHKEKTQYYEKQRKAQNLLYRFVTKNINGVYGMSCNSPFKEGSFFHKNDKTKKYIVEQKEVIDKIIKNDFDVSKALKEVADEIEYKLELDKLSERERTFKIKEQAEREYYGKVKTKRQFFTETEKDMIFAKFGNKCAICGNNEGLHIHHKDGNPKNNQMDNLIVLCGVCHKKVHMKVR